MDRMVRYGSPPLSISWVKEWGPALATIRCYSFTRVGACISMSMKIDKCQYAHACRNACSRNATLCLRLKRISYSPMLMSSPSFSA